MVFFVALEEKLSDFALKPYFGLVLMVFKDERRGGLDGGRPAIGHDEHLEKKMLKN